MPHINKSVDYTVEVFLVYKNRVLIRKHDKYDIYTGVGGHIEKNEDPVQAAIREVKEETGLEVKIFNSQKLSNETGDLIPPFAVNRHRISKTHEHVGFFYAGKVNTDKIVQQTGEESEDIKWLTREEILNHSMISSNIKTYALKALDLKFT